MGPRVDFSHKGVADILFVIMSIVVVVLILSLSLAGVKPLPSTINYGFGPGWDCSNPGRGGPICMKHLPPR
jgi:hypothetical protein